MKKLFSTAPILFLLLTGNHSATQTESLTGVHVGMGRTGSCTGRGICSASLSNGQLPTNSMYQATAGTDSAGDVFFEFNYADLNSQVISAQFSTDLFEVEADYPVPASVLRAIEAKDTVYTIKAGFYPLDKTLQTVKVTFH